jgi:hypothetical protein
MMTVMSPESSKTVASHEDEARIAASLAAKTPVQQVQFDEQVGSAKVLSFRIVRSQCNWSSPKRPIWAACAFLVGWIVLAAVLASILPRNNNVTEAPRPAETLPKHASNSSFTIDMFAETFIPKYSWEIAQRDENSPQAQALAFINATLSLYPSYRLQQRYALAVLYYSTSLSHIDSGAFGDDNECNWFGNSTLRENGDTCTSDKRYLVLTVDQRRVNGTIPPELEILSDLKCLNFSGTSLRGTIPPEL